MKAKEIIEIIENAAPLGLGYSWDNSGFLVGDINKEVKKIYITLDINMYTVDEAVVNNADMIISHHPIMFGGIKRIDYNTPNGYVLKKLIENNIAVYAAHTSMDCARGGINDILCEKLGIENTEIIEKNSQFEGCGLGRIGFIKKEESLKNFAKIVKENLKAGYVRICGDENTRVKKIAVGSGACDDLIPAAKEMGADVMVTSDMKYHISMDAAESGICVIDAGHFPTENFVIDIFSNLLNKYDLKITKSTESDVFKII